MSESQLVTDRKKAEEFAENLKCCGEEATLFQGGQEDISGEQFVDVYWCKHCENKYLSKRFERNHDEPHITVPEIELRRETWDDGLHKLDRNEEVMTFDFKPFYILHYLCEGEVSKTIESNPYYQEDLDIYYYVEDGQIIGTIVWHKSDVYLDPDVDGAVEMMFILKDRRGEGHGTQMLRRLYQIKGVDDQTNWSGIPVNTNKENFPFYEKTEVDVMTVDMEGQYI